MPINTNVLRKVGYFLLGLILTFIFIKYLMGYFLPFIVAILVTLLIEPVVTFFVKKLHLKRGLAVGLVMLLVISIFVFFIIAGVSQIYVELEKLSGNLPSYDVIWENLVSQNAELERIMNNLELSPSQQESVNRILEDLWKFIVQNIKAFSGELLGLLTKLPSFITLVMISFVATFFVSRDRRLLGDGFWRLIPKRFQRQVRQVKDEIVTGAVGFIRAELILISFTILIAIIGLEILNNDYALILGFLAGILDLIPIVGQAIIWIPWALISFITGDIAFGVSLLAIYAISVIVHELAEAKIIGTSLGVHPLATLVSMYVGAKAFGVIGFFIAPAFVIVFKALIKAGIITVFSEQKR